MCLVLLTGSYNLTLIYRKTFSSHDQYWRKFRKHEPVHHKRFRLVENISECENFKHQQIGQV